MVLGLLIQSVLRQAIALSPIEMVQTLSKCFDILLFMRQNQSDLTEKYLQDLYNSYQSSQYWDLIESPPSGLSIHLVRAANSDRSFSGFFVLLCTEEIQKITHALANASGFTGGQNITGIGSKRRRQLQRGCICIFCLTPAIGFMQTTRLGCGTCSPSHWSMRKTDFCVWLAK